MVRIFSGFCPIARAVQMSCSFIVHFYHHILSRSLALYFIARILPVSHSEFSYGNVPSNLQPTEQLPFDYSYTCKPVIVLFLTERNAWELCNVNSMQLNLPLCSVFFSCVEPPNSIGKILHSLEVKIHLNCLGRCWKPLTEWPERQLHLSTVMFLLK